MAYIQLSGRAKAIKRAVFHADYSGKMQSGYVESCLQRMEQRPYKVNKVLPLRTVNASQLIGAYTKQIARVPISTEDSTAHQRIQATTNPYPIPSLRIRFSTLAKFPKDSLHGNPVRR
jgi:hypothetical protein